VTYEGFSYIQVISSLDGKKYNVKKQFSDAKQASYILSKLNDINTKVIHHMQNKYANSASVDIDFLSSNYNGDVIYEHTPATTTNTSYVLNKGDLIKLCLRDPKTGVLHEMNTLIFVSLHELSHLLDKKYGHSDSFWSAFKTILTVAIELNLYTPVDYSKYPSAYCGLNITDNPLF
jgi:hypothetical protein